MIRFLFRFVGLWFLAGAFVALVIDGTRSIAASRLVITGFLDSAAAIFPERAELLQAAIERYLPTWLSEAIAAYVLQAPLWLVLGLIGALFALMARRRARPIGYSSRD